MTDELRTLFATAIELRQFSSDPSETLGQPDFPVCGPALVEAPLSRISQAETLFDELLHMLTYDPDATRSSLAVLYRELQRAYLAALYPAVFAEYRLVRHEGTGFLRGCPVRLQAVLLRYVALWLLRAPDAPHAPHRVPVACFLFEELLLGSAVDSEIVHEVLRQGLLLPWDHAASIKNVMALYRWWIFQPVARRPAFLTEDLHGMLGHAPASLTDDARAAGLIEAYTDRYIRRIESLFDGRPSFGVEAGQADVYREALFFLRAVAMGAYAPPTGTIWASLRATLQAILLSHFACPPKAEPIAVAEHAAAFATLLTETLAGVLVRSQPATAAPWEEACAVLRRAARWPPVVAEWCRGVLVLTALVAERGSPPAAPRAPKHRRVAAAEAPADAPPGLHAAPQDHFGAWAALPWSQAHAVFLWRNWLRTLGDIQAIERPEAHELAVRTLAAAADALRPCGPAQFEFDLLPALLDAAEHAPRPFAASRCVAVACLARVFLRAPVPGEFPPALWARFYSALINGLVDKDSAVAHVVLRASSHVFAHGLPGAHVLAPAYLRCIAGLLNGGQAADLLPPVLRLVCAVAVLPAVYGSMPMPRIEAPLPAMAVLPMSQAGSLTLDDARRQAALLLASADPLAPAAAEPPLLAALVVLLASELLAQPRPEPALVRAYLGLLLGHLGSAGPAVHAAVDVLAGLAVDSMAVTRALLGACHDALPDAARAVPLLRSLLAWTMALPAGWLRAHALLQKDLLYLLLQGLERGGETGRAAELLLAHLLHHLDARTLLGAPEPAPLGRHVHFALGTDSLFTLHQAPAAAELTVTTRNACGRHAWALRTFFTAGPDAAPAPHAPAALDTAACVPTGHLEPYRLPPGRTVPDPRAMPAWADDTDLEQTDMLADLLLYLDAEFPDLAPQGTGPDWSSPARRDAVARIDDAAADLVQLEAALATQCRVAARSPAPPAGAPAHRRAAPRPFAPAAMPFQQGRLLLAQLGLLTSTASKGPCRLPVALLGGANLGRDLGLLDALPPRHQHKIGLVYVPPGACREDQLLAPAATSPAYADFVRALGAYVPVDGRRYAGGLDPAAADRVLAHTTTTLEVVFHEPVLTRGADPVARKRHVGNDAVHIVWNESGAPYDPATIAGDFGNYQLVLTPLPQAPLYAVSIYADAEVPPKHLTVGPLFDGAVLPRALLAPLARATAIAADRLLAEAAAAPRITQADDRLSALLALVERSTVQAPPDRLLAALAFPGAVGPADADAPYSPFIIPQA